MNKYNFDDIAKRRNAHSMKWDVLDNELPMWVADMDFKILPEIKESLINRINIEAYGYSDVPDEYFEAYVHWWSSYHNVNLKKNNLIFSCGVISSIDVIFKTLLKKNDEILIFSPNYNVFYSCIKNNNLKPIIYNIEYNNYSYSLDFEKIEKLIINNKIKALLLCNPHNPIGKLFSIDELNKIINLCNQYNILLISDEIHSDIVRPGKHYNSVLLFNNYKNIIALLSPSKAFNLAGLHSSVIASFDNELLLKLQNALYKEDVGEANFFAIEPVIASYKYGKRYNEELNEYIFNNKDYFASYIRKYIPSIHVIESDATYLIWIDISALNIDSVSFYKDLRKKTGLYISNGYQYGENGKYFIRINVATSRNNVKECLKRLKQYINNKNYIK